MFIGINPPGGNVYLNIEATVNSQLKERWEGKPVH